MKLTGDQKEIGKAVAIGLPIVAALHYADAANTMVASPNAQNLSSAQTARTLVGLSLVTAAGVWFLALRK